MTDTTSAAYPVRLANNIVLDVRPVQVDQMQRPVLPASGYPSPLLVVDSGCASQLQRIR